MNQNQPDSIYSAHHPPQPGENTVEAITRRQAEQTAHGEIRIIKCTVSGKTFSAYKWAAARGKSGRPMPLAEFFQHALDEALRAIIRAEIGRGHRIPPNIAHLAAERQH